MLLAQKPEEIMSNVINGYNESSNLCEAGNEIKSITA